MNQSPVFSPGSSSDHRLGLTLCEFHPVARSDCFSCKYLSVSCKPVECKNHNLDVMILGLSIVSVLEVGALGVNTGGLTLGVNIWGVNTGG